MFLVLIMIDYLTCKNVNSVWKAPYEYVFKTHLFMFLTMVCRDNYFCVNLAKHAFARKASCRGDFIACTWVKV